MLALLDGLHRSTGASSIQYISDYFDYRDAEDAEKIINDKWLINEVYDL
jgi:hypothetical protein